MSQPTDTLKDDIAFMASLAREGPRPTFIGGEFLVVAGVLFGGASFLVSASLAGLIDLPLDWIWIGSAVLYFAAMPVLITRARRNPQFKTVGNRAVATAWSAIGWAIFTLGVSCAVIAYTLHTWQHMTLIAPIILSLYGVAWAVEAALSGRRWTKVLTVGCYVAAVAMAAIMRWPAAMFLGYGLCLILLAGLPGVVMMRLTRAAAQG